MPLTTSAIRALRNSGRKAARNAVVRKSYKELLKKTRKDPTAANLSKAFTCLDKAAQANVIHKNKANRLKSRLAKLVNKKAPPAATPPSRRASVSKRKTVKKTVKETKTRKGPTKKV